MADEKPATRAARPGALALAFLLLIYGTWYLITTLAAGATATSSAYVIGCAAVLLALLVVEIAAQIRAFIRPRAAAAGQDDTAQDPIRWRILAPMLLLMIAFAYVATQVDYIIGTLVFMVAAMIATNPKKISWRACLIAGPAAVVLVHLLFVVVLQANLPTVFGHL